MSLKKDEILDATHGGWDIFAHLVDKLPAVKAGTKISGHFKAPWRDEKHASTHLFMDGKTWLFKDFGDGSTGSAFDFIMKAKGVDFEGALSLAADYANITLPERANGHKAPDETVLYPDADLVKEVSGRLDTNFHSFCLGLGITEDHLAKWNVGGFKDIYTSFVYVRDDQAVVNIKHVAYKKDGKRNKDIKPWSMTSTVKGEVYKMCLFGEHLLSGTKPVCIVESEKTAVIASFFYPDYDWLATGGVFGARKIDYLRNGLADGRQCLVLLDADWPRKMPKALDILIAIGAKVETVDLFPERTDSTDIADYIVDGLHPVIVKDNVRVFWTVSDKGVVAENPSRFGQFLEENNFVKHYPDGANRSEFCVIEGKIIKTILSEKIKDFVLNYLKAGFPEKIRSHFFARPQLFKDDYLNGICAKAFVRHRDTKNKAYLYYRNCVVVVTKDKIETMPYSSLTWLVWEDHINAHQFLPDDGKKSEYEQFIELVAGNDLKVDAFRSAIGYMLHEFKDPGNAKCVILNDENIDGEAKGGAGKGIYCTALSHVRKLVQISGKKFDPTNPFSYQRVRPSTQIIEIADANETLDFSVLLNNITDGFSIERKNREEISLAPSESPKIIVSTNHIVKGSGGANDRRRYELEFTGHFHSGFTVADHFKHILFSDWDAKEWGRFHVYMVGCLKFFLENGLILDVHKTLKKRTLDSDITVPFREWCETEGYPISKVGEVHTRKDLLDSYASYHPTHIKMSWGTMELRIRKYAAYADLIFSDGNTLGRWIKLDRKPGWEPPMPDEEEAIMPPALVEHQGELPF